MLGLYVLSIVIFYIGLNINSSIINKQLKKDELVYPKGSLTHNIGKWTKTILLSLIPGINIIFIIIMFLLIDDIYYSFKKEAHPKEMEENINV